MENRQAICVNACVAPDVREVEFRLAGSYGGIQDNLSAWHEEHWGNTPVLKIKTRTLSDILEEYNAPAVIHYMSLDIEGGEAGLLESFPFERHKVLAMTVEKSSNALIGVIESKGFKIVENGFSSPAVDWEIHCVHKDFR